MFKKISLLAAGASAEYSGSSVAIPLCTTQTATVYTASILCNTASITLTGVDPPADNDATDGYTASMSVKFMTPITQVLVDIFYGVCVIPVETAGADDSTYMKGPRGMCLGNASTSAINNAGTPAMVNGCSGLMGGWFGHSGFADIVTNSALLSTAAKIENTLSATTTAAAAFALAPSTLKPLNSVTMNGLITYGVNTIPAATWYDNAAVTAYTLSAAAGTAFSTSTAAATATWKMPTEADTYADVPRLSANDSTLGWQAYAPDVGTSTQFGKMIKQLAVTQAAIIDNFATTAAVGVALVGATALSF